MDNASRAFAKTVRQSMRAIRQVIGVTALKPVPLTAAERIRYEGYLRREDINAAVLEQARAGMTIKEIVWRTRHSRGLVRKILRGQRLDVFRIHKSLPVVYLSWLEAQRPAEACNNAALWRQLRLQGFRGSSRVVA